MRIYFTPQALRDLERILSFLEVEWGVKSAKKLVSAVNKKVETIAQFPYSNPAYKDDEKARRVVVLSKTILTLRGKRRKY